MERPDSLFDLDSVYAVAPTPLPSCTTARIAQGSGSKTADNSRTCREIPPTSLRLLAMHEMTRTSSSPGFTVRFCCSTTGRSTNCDLGMSHFPMKEIFLKARRLMTWHYQWTILRQFLPAIAGASAGSSLASRSSQPDRGDGGLTHARGLPTDDVRYRSGGSGRADVRGGCGSLLSDTRRSPAAGRPTSRPRPSRTAERQRHPRPRETTSPAER